MVGKLAVSLAGHDKGSIFLVIREDGDVIWLADGISRLYQSPKRKKRKHVQLVLNLSLIHIFWELLSQNALWKRVSPRLYLTAAATSTRVKLQL